MTDTTTPLPSPAQVATVAKKDRTIGRLAIGSSTVVSVTGLVPFVSWVFQLAISNPANRPDLAVISFIAGLIAAGVNLGLQLFLRGREGAVQYIEGEER